MVELRCNTCPNLVNDFCTKMKIVLPNGQAKLFYGGAIGTYYPNVTYPSKCGIKEQARSEHEFHTVLPERNEKIIEHSRQI